MSGKGIQTYYKSIKYSVERSGKGKHGGTVGAQRKGFSSVCVGGSRKRKAGEGFMDEKAQAET